MIERNLGNVERVVRLLLGLLFGAWVLTREGLNPVEWFVMAVSLALILNGVFSRCYLWYILEINTCEQGEDCGSQSSCP